MVDVDIKELGLGAIPVGTADGRGHRDRPSASVPHQSVEAMVRTMKEVIEDKAHTRLSATDTIMSWMIRHAAFLQTRFSVGKDGKNTIQETTS